MACGSTETVRSVRPGRDPASRAVEPTPQRVIPPNRAGRCTSTKSRRWPSPRCSGSITRNGYSTAGVRVRNHQTGANPLVMVVPARAAPSDRSVHRSGPVGGKEACHVDRAGRVAGPRNSSHGTGPPTRRRRRCPPRGRDGVDGDRSHPRLLRQRGDRPHGPVPGESGAVPDAVGDPLLRAGVRLPRGDGRLSGGLPRPVAGRPRGVPRFAGALVDLPRTDGRPTRPLFRSRVRPGDLDGPVVDRGLVRRAGGAGLPAEPGGRGARGAADRDARPGRRRVAGLRDPRRVAGGRRASAPTRVLAAARWRKRARRLPAPPLAGSGRRGLRLRRGHPARAGAEAAGDVDHRRRHDRRLRDPAGLGRLWRPAPVDNAGDSAADRALVRQLYEATTFVALRADDARPGDRGPGGDRPRGHPRPGRPRPRDASAASRSSITSCNGTSSTGSPCWRAWRGDCRSPGSSRRRLWAPLPRAGRWACRASTPPGPWCWPSSTYRAVGSPGSRRAIPEAGCLTFDLNRSTQCGKPGSAAGAASYRVPGGSASL